VKSGVGYINVYIETSDLSAQANAAINAWRAKPLAGKLWLQRTTDSSVAQVEIIDPGDASLFGFGVDCQDLSGTASYARIFVRDVNGQFRGFEQLSGFWNPGAPFEEATICWNDDIPGGGANNSGTIAHELGHALGLHHVNGGTVSQGNLRPCPDPSTLPDQQYDSIMAYNNLGWEMQFPA
jgi:hypothetical protein